MLRIEDLSFAINHQILLRDINFIIHEKETIALVGESGCGKSTLAKILVRLLIPTGGRIFFYGREFVGYTKTEQKELQKHCQMVFQNPYSSLNPRMKVEEILYEPMVIHKLYKKKLREKALLLLDDVHLTRDLLERYPFELSGGQRQRVAIARALALEPKLLICDEILSALDLTIQSQVLHLLGELQQKKGLSYLFITHDMQVAKYFSDRMIVLHQGRIIEEAKTKTIIDNPKEKKTQELLSSVFYEETSAAQRNP